MNKIKKSILLLITITLALFNNTTLINAKDDNTNPNNTGEIKDMKTLKLYSDPEWKNLSQTWVELNQFGKNTGFELQNYSKLKGCIDKSEESIKALRAKGLLSKVQLDFLNKIFNDRITFLKYQTGVIDCYEMSTVLMEIVKTREDMEKRYAVLHKLFKENKINTETYEQTKQQIIQDLSSIDKKSEKPVADYNNSDLIDLLMNLNN